MFSFFLDNFLPIETISFLATGILIALSLIFCIFAFLLLLRSFETYQPGSQAHKKQTITLAMLAFLGIAISFTIKAVILPNFYLCDFALRSKDAI